MGISYGIEKSRAGGFWTEMTWLFTQAYWLKTVRLVQETQTYQYPIQKRYSSTLLLRVPLRSYC